MMVTNKPTGDNARKGANRRALSARNGIFGCGDRATEIAARDDGRPHRPKGPKANSRRPKNGERFCNQPALFEFGTGILAPETARVTQNSLQLSG